MNEIYRDPTEGAKARRLELLRRRRDELATMPHAIRRVEVARAARIAASLAALVCAAAMLALASSPQLAVRVTRLLPGPEPAPVSTFALAGWLVALVVYVAARAMHEHRFAVAMSQTVLPGADLDHDLERLSHERPDEVARVRAHGLEVRSAALPVAAAAALVPASLIYIVQMVHAHRWPSASGYEQALVDHAGALGATAIAGLVAAMVMTRRAARLPSVVLSAALVTGGAGFLAIVRPGAIGATARAVFVIAGAVALVVRRLRIERERIETEDPAAGSDVFTWSGVVRRVRAAIASVRAKVHRHHVRRAVGALAVVGASFGVIRMFQHHSTAKTPTAMSAAGSPQLPLDPFGAPAHPGVSTYTAIPSPDGSRTYELHFVDGLPIEIPSLAGLDAVPSAWRARITVEVFDDATVIVSPFADDSAKVQKVRAGTPVVFESCAQVARPLALHVDPLAGANAEVTLRVSAVLTPGVCDR